MNSVEDKICRLCLKTCNGEFETIQDKTKEILGVLVDVDFDISEGCVNCKKCMEMLQKCYDFISVCVHTEEKLIGFLKSRNINRANMTQVYLEDIQTNDSDLSVIDEICRFCMKPVANFFALDEIVDEYFSNMLKKFLPEVMLNNTVNPISCNNCLDSLKKYFTFVKHLQDIEENIRTYCEAESEVKRGKVDLQNVVQHMLNKLSPKCVDKITIFTGENMIQESYFTGLTVTEKCIQDQREMQNIPVKEIKEEISDTENYCLESSKEEGSSQNYIKMEEIEIKTEETIEDDIERKVPLGETSKEISDTENVKQQVNSQHYIVREEIEMETNETAESDVERYEKKLKKLQCSHCNYKSNHMGSLNRHLKCVHKIRFFSCKNCFYKTNSEDCLNKHQQIHGDNGKFKCPQCLKVCSTKQSIENHFLRKHDDLCDIITSKIYPCNICSYKTTYKADLFLHVNTKHSRLEKYQCNYCLHTYFNKQFLKRHISLVHLNLRQYVCKVCEKKFKKKASLDGHIVSYHSTNVDLMKTVTTIYCCEFCTFKAAHKDKMKRHMKGHSSNKLF